MELFFWIATPITIFGAGVTTGALLSSHILKDVDVVKAEYEKAKGLYDSLIAKVDAVKKAL